MNDINNNPKAIFFIIVGMSVFAIQDTLIKLISDKTNIFLIYLIRSMIGIILVSLFVKIRKQKIIFKTYYPKITILRCTTFFIAFSLYYVSLVKLSFALAATLFFVSPFFISIFSSVLLKETVGLKRWSAVIIGFFGVYLVMNPSFENFNFYTLLPIFCAFFYALTMILQKKYSKDTLFSQTLHLYIGALFFSSLLGIFIGNGQYNNYQDIALEFILRSWFIQDFSVFIYMIIIGIIGVIGFLTLIQAYRIGSPPSIAPFEYIFLIYAIFLSWLIWDETLDFKGFAGLFLIVGAGIYTFIRENKKTNKLIIEHPLR